MINSFLLLLLFSTVNLYAQTPKGGPVAKFDLLSREAFKEETPGSMIETYFELKKEMSAESIYKDFSLRAYISKDGTKGTVTGYFGNVLGFAAHPKVKKLKIGYNDYKKHYRVDFYGMGFKKPTSKFREIDRRGEEFELVNKNLIYVHKLKSNGDRRNLMAKIYSINPVLSIRIGEACSVKGNGSLGSEDRVMELVTRSANGDKMYHYGRLTYASFGSLYNIRNLPLKKANDGSRCIPQQTFTCIELGCPPVSGL